MRAKGIPERLREVPIVDEENVAPRTTGGGAHLVPRERAEERNPALVRPVLYAGHPPWIEVGGDEQYAPAPPAGDDSRAGLAGHESTRSDREAEERHDPLASVPSGLNFSVKPRIASRLSSAVIQRPSLRPSPSTQAARGHI